MHAINARGKCESVILFAMGQVMTTLSRLSEDVILFAAPEFGYFKLPAAYCTGSSIMPQKKNPDVFELIRAKAAGVSAKAFQVNEIVRALPCGYSRDLQETKAPFMDGISETLASLNVTAKVLKKVTIDKKAAAASLRPEIFATDKALKLVASGVPFREAYDQVKESIDSLGPEDTGKVKTIKLDLAALATRAGAAQSFAADERAASAAAVKKLLSR
jgi:argininosuccinate lyase